MCSDSASGHGQSGSADLVYEEERDGKWDVAYKVIGSIHIDGAVYSEAAVGSARLPSRGEAHDMAVKTAESDAFKRAAIKRRPVRIVALQQRLHQARCHHHARLEF